MPENICEFQITISTDNRIRTKKTPSDRDIEPCDIIEDKLQYQTIEILIEILRDNRMKETDEYRLLGTHLYHILLNNNLGAALNEALFEPDKSFEHVKVELHFEEGQEQLASWPWEYLYCPKEYDKGASGYFLASKLRLLLTRKVN